jgi:acetate kinase
MGTRSGTIDPAIIFHLLEKIPEDVHHLLEKNPASKALAARFRCAHTCGPTNVAGHAPHFRRVQLSNGQKSIYSYFAALGGPPDALVFTADIGEKRLYLREQICTYFKSFGLKLDPKRTRKTPCKSPTAIPS